MDSVSNHIYSLKLILHTHWAVHQSYSFATSEKLASSKQQDYIYPNRAKQKSGNEWFQQSSYLHLCRQTQKYISHTPHADTQLLSN